MTANDLVAILRTSGAFLRLEGRRLFVGPARRISDHLLAELRAHRAVLIDFARRSSTLEKILAGDVEPAADIPATTGDVAMPLKRFATAELEVPVHCPLLGGDIVLASDDAVLDPGERRPVFRAAELAHLQRLGPEAVALTLELKCRGCTIAIH